MPRAGSDLCCRQYGHFAISLLASNGSLVTGAVCRELKASGIKMVALSLDGASPGVHDDFRRQDGAFEGVMRATALLREHGIPFLINSSFTKRNEAEAR